MGPECRAHAAARGGRVTRRGGGKTSGTGVPCPCRRQRWAGDKEGRRENKWDRRGKDQGSCIGPNGKQVEKNKCSGKEQICTQCMCNATPLAGKGCAPLGTTKADAGAVQVHGEQRVQAQGMVQLPGREL